jgi:hypothetical protein
MMEGQGEVYRPHFERGSIVFSVFNHFCRRVQATSAGTPFPHLFMNESCFCSARTFSFRAAFGASAGAVALRVDDLVL